MLKNGIVLDPSKSQWHKDCYKLAIQQAVTQLEQQRRLLPGHCSKENLTMYFQHCIQEVLNVMMIVIVMTRLIHAHVVVEHAIYITYYTGIPFI